MIKELTKGDLINLSDDNFQLIYKLFTEELSKRMFPSSLEGQEFSNKFLKRMVDKMEIHLRAIAPMRQFKPTTFSRELMLKMLQVSEEVKREVAKEEHLTGYDVEKDIAECRKSLESIMNSEYKTEMKFLALMDEARYDEAKIILRAIEIERQDTDDYMRIEVVNWKMEIAMFTLDEDLFFQSLSEGKKINPELKYSSDDFFMVMNNFLSKQFSKGVGINLSKLGYLQAISSGANGATQFSYRMAQVFVNFLVNKICEAVMKKEEIKTGEDFRNFLKGQKMEEHITGFKLVNPYVDQIILPI